MKHFFVFGIAVIAVVAARQIVETTPDEAPGFDPEYIRTKISPSCITDTFCIEKLRNYPQKTINDLLTEKLKLELQPDSVELYNDGTDVIVVNRQSPPNEVKICKPYYVNYRINYIMDHTDTMRVVVQSHLFNQTIGMERCEGGTKKLTGDRRTVETFTPETINANNIHCDEIKLNYNFLVLTLDGKGVEVTQAKKGIPIACVCLIKRN